MADSGSSEDEGNPPTKIAKKKYGQKFHSDWMKYPAFKDWLVAATNANNGPSCKVCSKQISCSKTALQRHGSSAQHKQACSGATNQTTIHVSLRKLRGQVHTRRPQQLKQPNTISHALRLRPFLLELSVKARAPKNG